MPRYHYSVYDGHELVKDETGRDFEHLQEAIGAARELARSTLAPLVEQGKAVDSYMFYVGNEDGFTEAQVSAAEILGFETRKAR